MAVWLTACVSDTWRQAARQPFLPVDSVCTRWPSQPISRSIGSAMRPARAGGAQRQKQDQQHQGRSRQQPASTRVVHTGGLAKREGHVRPNSRSISASLSST